MNSWPISYIQTLEAQTMRFLKAWAGLPRCATQSLLFLPNKVRGLHLKKLSTFYKASQCLFMHLLSHSQDPAVCTVADVLLKEPASRWSGAKEFTRATSAHRCAVPAAQGQSNRRGLRVQRRRSERSEVVKWVYRLDEEEQLLHLHTLAKQGRTLEWDRVMEADFKWNHLIHQMTEGEFKFCLNATLDTLPTPHNLRLWGKTDCDKCSLCGHTPGTLSHILSHCPVALRQGRYTWRHNTVLRFIRKMVHDAIMEHHNKPNVPSLEDIFRRAPQLLDGTPTWKKTR